MKYVKCKNKECNNGQSEDYAYTRHGIAWDEHGPILCNICYANTILKESDES